MAKGKSKGTPKGKKAPEGSPVEEKAESPAKERKEQKAGLANAMPSGSPMAPGPINDPNDHPVNNLPAPTDPRWAEELQGQAQSMGQGGA